MHPALRLARPVLIGCGGAVAVWGTVYALQQRAVVASGRQPVHLSQEWGLDTKAHITRAATAATAERRVAEYETALGTVLTARTDVRAKSADWLAGYADLLRALGLAQYDAERFDDAHDALVASAAIPLGSAVLRARAAVTLFWLSNRAEPQYLLDAAPAPAPTLAAMRAPPLTTEEDVRAFAPLYLEAAKLLIDGRQYDAALASLVALHRAMGAAAESDPLCYKPAAGGYIGQVLWQLGRRSDAAAWLRLSEADAAQCRTPACKDVRATLRALLARAQPAP